MSILFLDYLQDNISTAVSFSPLSDQDGLPFPLYLHPVWKVLLAITLIFTLIKGTRLRKIIIDYIISPESKLGPINYLIWVDQINSIFLGINVLFRIILFLSPIPISTLIGSEICNFTEFIFLIFLAGSYAWSCYIALFRVLFIKAQKWLTDSIGIKNLLWIMLIAGTAQILFFANIILYIDEDSFLKKICYHLSLNDVIIMQDYQVNLHK